MYPRALQADSTSSNSTTSCVPTSSNNGTSNACPSTSANSADEGFANTALWAVVLAVIGAVALLSFTLFYLKRRMRVRARQRVRAALWDMVRGVRDGSVDETALRRLVNEAFGEPKAPIIYEVQLSFYDAPLVDDNANEQEHKKALPLWKWMDLRPLSTTHPYPLSNDAKDAYPRIKVDRSSSTTKPTENVTKKPLKPSSRIERRIDPVFMITMPHPDRPWHLPITHPLNSSNVVNVVDVPVKFGSSSTTFLEDVHDQIVPPHMRMKRRREEALSGALSSSRVGGVNASMAARMEAQMEEEERVRREERNRRWIDEGHDWFGLNDIRR